MGKKRVWMNISQEGALRPLCVQDKTAFHCRLYQPLQVPLDKHFYAVVHAVADMLKSVCLT